MILATNVEKPKEVSAELKEFVPRLKKLFGYNQFEMEGSATEEIDELAEKSTEWQLSAAEEAEYDDYIEAIDIIGILQAKARSALARHRLS